MEFTNKGNEMAEAEEQWSLMFFFSAHMLFGTRAKVKVEMESLVRIA